MVLVLLISVLGAYLTYELSQRTRLGGIRSSAGVTLIFALVSPFIFVESDSEALSGLFFGGSFVGMTSTDRLKRPGIIWSGLLFGVVYWTLSYYVSGIGGALGMSAFISVALTVLKRKGLSLLAQR